MKYIFILVTFLTLTSCDEEVPVDPFAVSDKTRDSIYLKVRELTSNQKYSEAEQLLSTIRARDIYDQDFYYLISNVKTVLNKQSEAIHYLRLALRVTRQQAAIHYLLAQSYGSINMKDSAITSLNRAIAVDTENQGYLRARIKYYIDNQLPILALDDANRLVRIDSSVNNLLYRARCFYESGDTAQSLKEYHLVLDRNPNSLDALKSLGFIYLHQEKLKKSKEYLNKYLDTDPTNGEVFYGMAVILSRENKTDKACDCLVKAVDLGDRDAMDHIFKCEEYLKKKGINIQIKKDTVNKTTTVQKTTEV